MDPVVLELISASLLISALIAYALFRRKEHPLPLPPGPAPFPFLGNVYDMPNEYEWLTYSKWGQTFGPLIHIHLFGKPIIIINSYKIASDLLIRHSTNRPKLTMAGELMGWDLGVALIQGGERHRKYRRMMSKFLGAKVVESYAKDQEKGVVNLVAQLIHSRGAGFDRKVLTMIASGIVRIAYGEEVTGSDDPYVIRAEKAQEIFSIAATPNTYAVDFLPFLKYVPAWMPGAKFQREALEAKEELYDMVQSPVRGMKARLAAGEASNSYIGKLLEEGEYEEDYIAWSAISVYTGGADTTVSAMNNFILSMMLNPDAQRAAQKEIDSIVGNQRLPRLEDRPALKYVNACIKETQRWRTVTPLGVAHVCEKEDSYGGYRIPKGATLIGNIWAMMHDEEIYSDPFKFLPERFLDDERNENSKRSKEKDVMYAFGFGRRICPGMHLADQTLFITAAIILATLDIEKPPHLKEPIGYTSGMISHPMPFECVMKPRSQQALELIKTSPLLTDELKNMLKEHLRD